MHPFAGHSPTRPDFRLENPRVRGCRTGSLPVLALLLFWLGAAAGNGAVTTFLFVNGVSGGSTQSGHPGWMDAISFNHRLTRTLPQYGVHGAVDVTKYLDKGSPVLDDLMCRGSIISRAQIEFFRSSPTFSRFYNIILTNVVVASIKTALNTNDAPVERVSLHYEQIAWTYTELDSFGGVASTRTATWNRTNNVGSYNGTNYVTDTDLDGMPDAYESANGLNPMLNDAGGDLDGDGLTNYQEFLAGTNPNNFNSVFRVTRINLATGQVRITWNSVAGKTYTLHGASQVDGPYTPVRTVASAGNGETFTDFSPLVSRQFYRVSTP